jgi:hypothetical protein
MAIVIAALGVAGCGGGETLPPLPPPPRSSPLHAPDVSGCYEQVTAHPLIRHAAPWQPPKMFLLTKEPFTTVPREGRIVTLWKVKQTRTYEADGMWRMLGDGMLEISWSNGFEGVRVRLRRRADDDLWRGWTEPYSDGGVAVDGARICVARVNDGACRFRSR